MLVCWVSGAGAAQPPAGLFIRAGDFFVLDRVGKSTAEKKDPMPGFRRYAFGGGQLPEANILAFEEHQLFTMIVADLTRARGGSEPRLKDDSPRMIRRLLLLKPSTFVVDDEIRATASGKRLSWTLQTVGSPKVGNRQIRIEEGQQQLFLEMLLPRVVQIARGERKAGNAQAGYTIAISPDGQPDEARFLNVVRVREAGDKEPVPPTELAEQGPVRMTVRCPDRSFQLSLPRWRDGAGEIAAVSAEGKALLERRPLATGILPHSAEGVRMIERWDAAYRAQQPPPWDIGRPASDLVKAVESGLIKPCRAVDLGCGSGTNAIYLAGKGFEVTGMDLAPTALSIAHKKAQEAGVDVRWLLADVLAPPKLPPFELIFDRGCYHGVRKDNAAQYVAAVRRLSKPGTRILILAGNANEPPPHSGPPRVKEEEIRADFSKQFEFDELRETRFDSADPQKKGALAWFILLSRAS
jgi:SAM-dependent methyltransferase